MTASLLRDPIYQLNLVLWMLEELPQEAPTYPLLRNLGYELHSIGGNLSLPPDSRLRVADSGLGVVESPGPDVIASRARSSEFLLIECKGASFGAGSSNADQARGMLIASSDLRGPLGLAAAPEPVGIVGYLVPEPEAVALQDGLGDVKQQLERANLPSSSFTVLGVEERADGVYVLNRHPPASLPPDAERAIATGARILETVEGEVARRLYFIPWDPSVDQSAEEKAFCRRILLERVLAELVAAAGRSSPSSDLQISMEALLDRATFGLATRWRARREVTNIVRVIRTFVRQLIEKGAPGLPMQWDGPARIVTITLRTADDRDQLLRAIEEGRPAEWLKRPDFQQPGLFEDEAN